MRIWAATDTAEPLDITRNTGDSAKYSAKFRKAVEDIGISETNNTSAISDEIGEITLNIAPPASKKARYVAISVVGNFQLNKAIINITKYCTSNEELNKEIDRLQAELENLRSKIFDLKY